MNKELFRELAHKATQYCCATYSVTEGPQAWAWEDKFAEYIYKDIIKVVAAHALHGDSALTTFTNLTRIYEGVNLQEAQDNGKKEDTLDF